MIAILDTGVANSGSVLFAIERLGYKGKLTRDPDQLVKSSRVIFPGVGTAVALMDKIESAELKECLRTLTQPTLGICLGMQAFYEFSEEGEVQCLGVFPGRVQKLKPEGNLSVPHMGWNQILPSSESQLLKEIPEGSYFYFVHSFRVPQGPEVKAFSEYGEQIPAVIESASWFGTQFHPERSGKIGEKLIQNFLDL